jgi:predicted PhzF superfamily epimerase YddE/YHI9
MRNEVFQVDSFTDKPFTGNPAGVMLLDSFPDERRMQAIAAEMNLAETSFVVPRNREFDLRWFTPTVEVDLCGHATLAAAHILWETKRLGMDSDAVFQTRSGQLKASRSLDRIELSLPTLSPRQVEPPPGLLDAVRVNPVYVGISKFDYLVQLGTAQEVRSADIDFSALAKIETRGVILTAASDVPEYDFISRFFAPAAGINEDPVTGSAHCVLGVFWAGILGRRELRAYQASPRGGSLGVRVDGDRTHLIGSAVTVMRVDLLV